MRTFTQIPGLLPKTSITDSILNDFFREPLFNDNSIPKYPATDIYIENGVTYIEVAVTGFSKENIEVYTDKDVLYIIGDKRDFKDDELSQDKLDSNLDNRVYHMKHISRKNFTRKFNLLRPIDSIDATIENGILKLKLVTVPDIDTKKKFLINDSSSKNTLEQNYL